MRLSEAIRLGAMLGPQAFKNFKAGTATCAWGSALAAVGLLDTKRRRDATRKSWPWTKDMRASCPARGVFRAPRCYFGSLTVAWMIEHLNDEHRWTRERIADWVASIEPQSADDTDKVKAASASEPERTL